MEGLGLRIQGLGLELFLRSRHLVRKMLGLHVLVGETC